MKLPCISLWQPWASLVACGAKTVETRSWAPPSALIGGRLGIHAAASTKGLAAMREDPSLYEAILQLRMPDLPAPHRLPRGALLATAVLEAVVPVERLHPDPFGDYSPGRCGWLLSDVRPLTSPIPARGRQRIWYHDRHPLRDLDRPQS